MPDHEDADLRRVMDEMEDERDQRERRAMRSGGYGETGPGGIGRLPPGGRGEVDRLRRDWDQGGRGGPGANHGPAPQAPPGRGRDDGPPPPPPSGGGQRQASYRGREAAGGGGPAPATPDHRGRGPKGYKRSDERILEDVNDRLTEDPRIDASEVQVDVQAGEVTLTGTVGSREERRRAEDVAEGASGVTYVLNNLRVRQPGGSGVVG